MATGIYLIKENGDLVEMSEHRYDSEDLLQTLLAKYPNLLAGDQIDSLNPRKWLLVSREMAIPDKEEGGGRWSVDHLFLDQDAVPTLIEVKRSSDTRIRREVIGQLLEYASNAASYWSIEKIRATFEASCENSQQDPKGKLMSLLEIEDDYDDFWTKVEANLDRGKIRLVFVADEIPIELQSVVEFLNEQMNPAEVLAIEIKQYIGQKQKTLVPRVIGQTSKVLLKKSASKEKREWDERSFLKELENRNGAEEAKVATQIMNWCKSNNLRLEYGSGKQSGSCFAMLDHKGQNHSTFALWTYGGVEIQFQWMNKKPYDDISKRQELLNELNQLPRVSISEERLDKRPSIPYALLKDKKAMVQFFDIWQKYIENIKKQD